MPTRDTTSATKAAAARGGIGTDRIETPFGNLDSKGGYPTEQSARKLADHLAFNRAVELYLSQMPVVSWNRVWKGVAEAGTRAPNQLVIWETLMDAETLLLTGNTETVYALGAIDLKRDGPTVVEVPAGLLGGISNLWQGEIAGIGP